MRPAHERFQPDNFRRIEPNDGLVMRQHAPLGDRQPDVAHHIDALDDAGPQIPAEWHITAAIGFLGVIERKIGVLAESVGVLGIAVEQRAASEVTGVAGSFGSVPWAPEAAAVYNPAFDVTPAALISGWVLDTGAVSPDEVKAGIFQP